jgi:hypothetical protein
MRQIDETGRPVRDLYLFYNLAEARAITETGVKQYNPIRDSPDSFYSSIPNALSPAGIIFRSFISCSTRSKLRFDVVPVLRRGVKR